MTSANPTSLEPLVVGVSGRRMVLQGVASGLFAVLLLVGAAAFDSWYLGLLGVLMVGVAGFSLYQAKTFQPALVADQEGVSLAKAGPDGTALRIPWEDVERVFVHKVRGVNVRLLCVQPRDVTAYLPADPKQRSQVRKSVEITGGAPQSANLAAASISDDRALNSVRNLAHGRTTVG